VFFENDYYEPLDEIYDSFQSRCVLDWDNLLRAVWTCCDLLVKSTFDNQRHICIISLSSFPEILYFMFELMGMPTVTLRVLNNREIQL